jgi:hypothetical protein
VIMPSAKRRRMVRALAMLKGKQDARQEAR